ncbi:MULTISPECIES: hypothetical protein [Gammaproteobacteria]|uniref:hypothetical protein n=1 Tax=Gammaproteobacteria TaxID=1236 RepID=UPI001ADC8A10|nr:MULTISPECIES: hypothetical protein [Gammaproteobacteria]MBO9480036.1 hypothetical protein [Salinisphaera sp. G21_0]MBO9493372.1 hypothetical protein [Thalassotalea sp. G20_0]
MQYDTVLFYINGGTIHAPGELPQVNTGPELDFAWIATRTTSIVIGLKDIA